MLQIVSTFYIIILFKQNYFQIGISAKPFIPRIKPLSNICLNLVIDIPGKRS